MAYAGGDDHGGVNRDSLGSEQSLLFLQGQSALVLEIETGAWDEDLGVVCLVDVSCLWCKYPG